MRIPQLIYLETIAETGSMNEAAKQLFISQPSLTQVIKELEKEYDIQLFYRSKTGMTLTEEGREFINYARAILDQVNLLYMSTQKWPVLQLKSGHLLML